MWSLGYCDCAYPELDAGAEGEFSQAATFEGQGQGILAITFEADSYSGAFGGFSGYLSVNTAQYSDERSLDMTISVPITFGTPITIGGFEEAYGYDNDFPLGTGLFGLLDMQVYNSSGALVGDYPGLIQAESATYLPAPESGSLWLGLTGLGVLWWMRSAAVFGIDRNVRRG